MVYELSFSYIRYIIYLPSVLSSLFIINIYIKKKVLLNLLISISNAEKKNNTMKILSLIFYRLIII